MIRDQVEKSCGVPSLKLLIAEDVHRRGSSRPHTLSQLLQQQQLIWRIDYLLRHKFATHRRRWLSAAPILRWVCHDVCVRLREYNNDWRRQNFAMVIASYVVSARMKGRRFVEPRQRFPSYKCPRWGTKLITNRYNMITAIASLDLLFQACFLRLLVTEKVSNRK